VSAARVRFGAIWIDAVTAAGALEAIDALVARREGGAVFTPNVDHVVLADRDERLRAAYARADLSLCDGQPLRWTSPLLGLRLPEKVSGSDLFLPLMRHAARRRWRVYLLGGAPGVADAAGERLAREEGVEVVGVSAAEVGIDPLADEAEVAARVAAARPDLVAVCLGAPKGELWVDRVRERLRPAVAVQLGASMDFYVGRARRAPRWMQRAGLEWAHRLAREPRRLARRYLLQDPAFAIILLRTMLEPESARVRRPAVQESVVRSRPGSGAG
jgi:N-acetylglucosaminyldiphosphoundecaprenol N-acetyl-beta-D-mannosaminyltransferase